MKWVLAHIYSDGGHCVNGGCAKHGSGPSPDKPPAHSACRRGRERGRSIPFTSLSAVERYVCNRVKSGTDAIVLPCHPLAASRRLGSSRSAQKGASTGIRMKVSSNVRRRFSDNPQGEEIGDARDALNAAQNNSKLRCGQLLRCLSQAAMYCSGILRVRTPGTVLIDTRYPHRSHHQRTSPRRFGEYSGSCPFGQLSPHCFYERMV